MEFTPDMYRSQALRQYYGVSLWTDPGPAREHLAKLRGHPYYMTGRRIADLSGISQANLCQIMLGRRGEERGFEVVQKIHRDTEAAILGVRPEIDETRRGGYVPPEGTRRRLQALVAAGFPLRIIAEGLGYEDIAPQPVWRIIRGTAGVHYVHAATYRAAVALYEKLDGVDPEDMGVLPASVKRAKGTARQYGYAPAWAWDDDTIDDPEAFPEWTGACGTEDGYRIHIRETLEGNLMPPCPACRAVVEVVREKGGEKPFVFHREAFTEALKGRGLTPRGLARKMGRDPKEADRFYRWRKGERSPQNRAEVHAVAAALDLAPSALMHDEPDDEAKPNIIGEGAFNHYAFKAIVEMKELSQREVADIVGVTHGSVHKWTVGSYSPKDKTVLKPLADRLGIDVEVFYS